MSSERKRWTIYVCDCGGTGMNDPPTLMQWDYKKHWDHRPDHDHPNRRYDWHVAWRVGRNPFDAVAFYYRLRRNHRRKRVS